MDHPLLIRPRPFTRQQACDAGLPDSTLRQALRAGRLRRVCREVYVPVACPDDLRTRVLGHLLRCGPQACGSHETAAALWGVRVDALPARDADAVTVTLPPRVARPQLRGLRVVHAEVPDDAVLVSRGVRLTSPGRTAADLVRERDLVAAAVAADALAHRWPAVVDDLAGESRRLAPRARGAAVLRDVLRHLEPRAESPMESRLRMLLVLAGLPRPEAQHVVRVDGEHVARLDLAYVADRVAVEYDGREAHPVGLAADRRRLRALQAAGWVVLQFTAEDVLGDPARVVAEVRAALLRARLTR